MKWTKYLEERPPIDKLLAICGNNGRIYLAKFSIFDYEIGYFKIFYGHDINNKEFGYRNGRLNVKYWIELPKLPEEK